MRYPSLLALLALLVIATACGCIDGGDTPPAAPEHLEGTVTVVHGDASVTYDYDDIVAMPSWEGVGYAVSTVGIKYGPYQAMGVPLIDLITLSGPFGEEDQAWISADDGYMWVFDYDQVMGEGFITFDEDLHEIESPPLTVILMYEQDGMPLTYNDGGPFRVVVATDEGGVITEGSSWVKWVSEIEVK
jgi:DMSO/TMAO reductase YedYZ molybdopterin-dependent catalytic subunit